MRIAIVKVEIPITPLDFPSSSPIHVDNHTASIHMQYAVQRTQIYNECYSSTSSGKNFFAYKITSYVNYPEDRLTIGIYRSRFTFPSRPNVYNGEVYSIGNFNNVSPLVSGAMQ